MIEIAKGLLFPEGPIAMPDGSVLVVEIARGTFSQVLPDGSIQVVGECGGDPTAQLLVQTAGSMFATTEDLTRKLEKVRFAS